MVQQVMNFFSLNAKKMSEVNGEKQQLRQQQQQKREKQEQWSILSTFVQNFCCLNIP